MLYVYCGYCLYTDSMLFVCVPVHPFQKMDTLEQYLISQTEDALKTQNRLLREVAYERLKDAIQHADLQPGLPLSETQLSKYLGISRTPVREALQQLAQEGLVQIIPGRAVTIASRSIAEVLNAVHIRSLLEPELARLAAESATAGQVELLQQTVEEMAAAAHSNDQATWSRVNTRYHELMSEACPNQLLGELVLQMCNRVHHLADIDSQTNPARITACTQEHQRIVEAIAARNPQLAEQAMHDHIRELRESLFNRLSRLGYS